MKIHGSSGAPVNMKVSTRAISYTDFTTIDPGQISQDGLDYIR